MRVAFLGNDAWSVPSLRALAAADDVDLELVLTNPPRPAGRGSHLTPTPVADVAVESGLPLLEIGRVRDGEGFDALDALEPDAIVVVAYGEILTPDVLDIPRLGAVNVHFSSLPRWRGAAPVQRAILEGDGATGVTVMLMDEGLDTGPVLLTVETSIDDEENAGSLGSRLAELGGPLLIEALRGLDDGSPGAAFAGPCGRDRRPEAPPRRADHRLDPPVRCDRPARARARTRAGCRDDVPSGSVEGPRGARPGCAWPRPVRDGAGGGGASDHRGGGVEIHAGSSTVVELVEVAPAGRKRMSGAEWARGARFQAGEKLT